MTDTTSADLATAIGGELPYLRRYARALTGKQETGDRYAAATLEAILADRNVMHPDLAPKVALFRAFHLIWNSSGAPVDTPEDETPEGRAQQRLAGLTRNSREALLLHSIEGFTADQIGQIMDLPQSEASHLVGIARREMATGLRGDVMIIEDEAVIAMDLSEIVKGMGHQVTGIARTRDDAENLAARHLPDLILADIQLADNSSGIDAVNAILQKHGDRPIIFITAFPERLLTGERPEPAFLIAKPYTEEQVRSAVSQAMFFASTEMLDS
ncbi:response regulator [Sedimentitalea nanhaiensis]|uniref:CheY chemotaxis protein or a CheY-like REC (Receiver) domain n=1 Tax=Sedimentitalea nanhaiensis TaxID=999627 RepID=A0A1I7E6K6_9RHOB|nr:response regulator [Sedimentitalea nanhaiensis]SFU19581.1 CheY chemotaxis protein or a CheY-like REC (receiver) domain [Sedimentitalea nanhaiensis]